MYGLKIPKYKPQFESNTNYIYGLYLTKIQTFLFFKEITHHLWKIIFWWVRMYTDFLREFGSLYKHWKALVLYIHVFI